MQEAFFTAQLLLQHLRLQSCCCCTSQNKATHSTADRLHHARLIANKPGSSSRYLKFCCISTIQSPYAAISLTWVELHGE